MSGRRAALVVLNPAAHQGTAEARYAQVRPALQERFDVQEIRTDLAGAWVDVVHQHAMAGARLFVAAGGDGTVHALVNALDQGPVDLHEITLGAVGLGSSNDFHKPVERTIAGIPVRIDADAVRPRDLVRVAWVDGEASRQPVTRVCAVSASIGFIAAANGLFNRGDGVLSLLKKRWTAGAIAWTGVRELATWKNVPADLRLAGTAQRVALTNLSVLETPSLSGRFRYDTPVDDCDGHMVVNLIEGRSSWQLAAALASLARGRFLGRPGTHSWTVDHLEVELETPADLELDGEVFIARSSTFDVLPRRILRCT